MCKCALAFLLANVLLSRLNKKGVFLVFTKYDYRFLLSVIFDVIAIYFVDIIVAIISMIDNSYTVSDQIYMRNQYSCAIWEEKGKDESNPSVVVLTACRRQSLTWLSLQAAKATETDNFNV